MNGRRAAAVLRGLEKNELVVDSADIEEILGLGLAVEADPDDLQLLTWLQPVVRQYAGCDIDTPMATQRLASALRAAEDDLRKDWYRMKASKAEIAAREEGRITMRRALAYLGDPKVHESCRMLLRDAQQLPAGTTYVCCQQLGSEYYAITLKGWRVRRQLKIRLDRFGEQPLKSFLASYDKVENKMRAFSLDVATLSQNIGYVKKNRESVVIGLVKTGLPAPQALARYKAALLTTHHAPDVAVTCARNAATYGTPGNVASRLRQGQEALRHAGFPNTPVAMGAAKSLLSIDPPAAGVPRFRELFHRLEQAMGHGEANYKLAARLMPAAGTPEQLVRRAFAAATLLNQNPSRTIPSRDIRAAAVALASMVRADDQLASLVLRLREIEFELVRAGVSQPALAESDALECIACPGSPAEVVDIVSTLSNQLASGRRTERADVAVAVAFAKRFAL